MQHRERDESLNVESNQLPVFIREAKRSRFDQDYRMPCVPTSHCPFTSGKSSQSVAQCNNAMIVSVPWYHPQKFVVDDSWLWAGGEESSEVCTQKQRESKIFEALYPQVAFIPDSPHRFEELNETSLVSVPEIPLDSLDEDEIIVDSDNCQASSSPREGDSGTPMTAHEAMRDEIITSTFCGSFPRQRQLSVTGLDPDVVAAVSMALRAMGDNDLVDKELLFEILRDPSLLESLADSFEISTGKSSNPGKHFPSELACLTPKGPLTYTAHLNTSPRSVLSDSWSNDVVVSRPHTMPSVVNDSSRIQQQKVPLPSRSYPSQTSVSLPHTTHVSSDRSQQTVECLPRMYKQICEASEMDSLQMKNSNEAINLIHPSPRKHEMRSGQASFSNGSQMDRIFQTYTDDCLANSCTTTPIKGSFARSDTMVNGLPKGYNGIARAKGPHGVCTRIAGRGRKLCLYFNSPRGCRNGETCSFIHQSLDAHANAVFQ
ncbi:hypothetical protein KP509_1Z117400 [Ceratopteris richardii]|nr:hypothetical protein KP509_1Z117400 [Ceratopteris richardii]